MFPQSETNNSQIFPVPSFTAIRWVNKYEIWRIFYSQRNLLSPCALPYSEWIRNNHLRVFCMISIAALCFLNMQKWQPSYVCPYRNILFTNQFKYIPDEQIIVPTQHRHFTSSFWFSIYHAQHWNVGPTCIRATCIANIIASTRDPVTPT